MKVFRIFKYRCKDLYQQKWNWLALFLLPIVAIFIAGGFVNQTVKNVAVPIAVVDLNQSDYSRFVIKEVSKSNAIRILNETEEGARRLLEQNKVDSVYVLTDQFEQKIIQLEETDLIQVYRTPMSLSSGIVRELFASAVTRLSSNVMAADKVVSAYEDLDLLDSGVWEEAWQFTDNQWKPEPLMTIDYREQIITIDKSASQPEELEQKRDLSRYLVTTLAMFILVPLLSSTWIMEDRTHHRLKRLRSLRVGIGTYLVGNTLPFLFTFLSSSTIVLIILARRLNEENVLGIAFIIVFYILACIMLSLWIGSSIQNPYQLYVVTLALFLLSISVVGAGESTAANTIIRIVYWIFPSHWAMQSMVEVMDHDIFPARGIAVLMLMSCLFFLMARRRMGDLRD